MAWRWFAIATFLLVPLNIFGSSTDPSTCQDGYQRPGWLESLLRKAEVDGLLAGYPDLRGSYHYHGPTRYQDAAALYVVAANLSWAIEEAQKALDGRRTPYFGSEGRSDRRETIGFLQRTATWLPDLKRGILSYEKELGLQGADLEELKTKVLHLDKAAANLLQRVTPFPDVPPGHWAYQAANGLKAAGILHGYPSGKFVGL